MISLLSHDRSRGEYTSSETEDAPLSQWVCLEPWLSLLLSRPQAYLHLSLGATLCRHGVLAALAVALALATPVDWMNWLL